MHSSHRARYTLVTEVSLVQPSNRSRINTHNLIMSAFTQGMDNLRENKLIPGENGTLELISTGESLVDLFFKVMRNMSADSLEAKVNTILRSVTSLESDRRADDTTLVDLFVMCMQTRDCRGGIHRPNHHPKVHGYTTQALKRRIYEVHLYRYRRS